jgi:dihydroflavonol-4-reductase
MTRALVTGSTGCVGSNLVAALIERGIEVVGLRWGNAPTIALDGLDLDLVCGDILDIETLHPAMEDVDWVFHVAAIADDWNHSDSEIYRTNVQGTRNALAAAYDAGVSRFVLTSSAAALGAPRAGRALLDETCEFNLPPSDWVYGHSKALAEQAVAEYVERGLHAVCVLPTMIMGPGDVTCIGGQFVTRAVRGDLFPLPAGGTNVIDARDVARAHVAAAQRGAPGDRFVLGGHNMTHSEYLSVIEGVVGVEVKRLLLPRWTLPSLANGVTVLRSLGARPFVDRARILLSAECMFYDNSKAVRELGLTVRPFAETVSDTFHWYESHGLLHLDGSPIGGQKPWWRQAFIGKQPSKGSTTSLRQ